MITIHWAWLLSGAFVIVALTIVGGLLLLAWGYGDILGGRRKNFFRWLWDGFSGLFTGRGYPTM